MIIPLDNTIRVIVKCFEKAETETIKQVKGIGTCIETEITLLFRFNLTRQLRMAGEKEQLSKALVKDLKSQISILNTRKTFREVCKKAEGLLAGVSWHPAQTEGKITGADFALLISHPKIDCDERRSFKPIDIETNGSQCGLLSQAKLKRYKKEWGKIKAN